VGSARATSVRFPGVRTSSESEAVAVRLVASETATAKREGPAARGVPNKTPSVESAMPSGSAPSRRHTSGGAPPATWIAA
jgi:hypothetical protein